MSAKSSSRVLQDYVDYLNGLCNQTITESRLAVVKSTEPFFLIACLQSKEIIPLKLRPKGWLHFRQMVSLKRGKICVDDSIYRYSLSPNPDDENEWVFRYEYCLNPVENVPHAHLHLNADKDGEPLRHIHFPTGRISIEQIIAHLIIEHKVECKMCDWYEYLAKSHEGFTKRRTDPQSKLFL